MKAYDKLVDRINSIKSYLCVGLDTDIDKMPLHMRGDVDKIIRFNRAIIDATKDSVCSYKINFAFYEQYGIKGFEILKQTFDYIPDDIFTIADAKRGDIGNTSKAYAKSCFDYFGADSITVNPYMGMDSVLPFLEYEDKMVFILGLTSNKGSNDFQQLLSSGKKIYEHIIEKTAKWASFKQTGYVVGATHPEAFGDIRKIIPDNPLLIPGVGSQGGDMESVLNLVRGTPVIINVSRGIIYASPNKDYANISGEVADKYHKIMFDYIL